MQGWMVEAVCWGGVVVRWPAASLLHPPGGPPPWSAPTPVSRETMWVRATPPLPGAAWSSCLPLPLTCCTVTRRRLVTRSQWAGADSRWRRVSRSCRDTVRDSLSLVQEHWGECRACQDPLVTLVTTHLQTDTTSWPSWTLRCPRPGVPDQCPPDMVEQRTRVMWVRTRSTLPWQHSSRRYNSNSRPGCNNNILSLVSCLILQVQLSTNQRSPVPSQNRTPTNQRAARNTDLECSSSNSQIISTNRNSSITLTILNNLEFTILLRDKVILLNISLVKFILNSSSITILIMIRSCQTWIQLWVRDLCLQTFSQEEAGLRMAEFREEEEEEGWIQQLPRWGSG